MEVNNNPLKVFKLKTCRKCGSKDVRYFETPVRQHPSLAPEDILYVGCASCGYCHTVKCLEHDANRNIYKNRLITMWNADRNYKDKRNKKITNKKEKKNATVTD